ncbi:MAG: electron transfer flavoprotein subunit alpha/FixB family protein [Deltaproteobacteria bacterium]|nr:MAG: electron transfer flavoprotein subunit alpha/FixB family protein [Deltaproteobacteria bacterium]
MSTILVVAEQLGGELKSATLPTIGFAKQAAAATGGEVVVLVLGSGASGAAEAASRFGASRVLYVDGAQYADYLAENYAPAVVEVAKSVGATVVCAPSTTTGKDFLPRVAALLDAGFVSDAIDVAEVDGDVVYKRPIWSGNLIARVTSHTDITAVTVRTTAFEAPAEGAAVSVETISVSSGAATNAAFVSFDQVKTDRPPLTDADVVIAGGRGLKSGEAFGMLEELADKLGAAVGASRAAVDSGYAPNDWQIGQTGKIIAPNLYIGVAISGAIQHLAGMKASKVIVAINKDPEAPIFQVSDFGLVEDAFKAVPELTSKL